MEPRITLYDKTFVPFISARRLTEAIDRVAEKINADFADARDVPVLLCILNGSLVFTSELMKRLTFPLELACTRLSSYVGTSSTGQVRQTLTLPEHLEGRRVIVVEDIVDTGNTISALSGMLQERKVAEVRICTLLLKPEAYHKEIPLDYVALEIPNRFIVGFGLDYDQIGRNLPEIYVLENS